MPKIEKLTPAQEQMLVEYREESLRIGRSTEPSDRPRAEAAWKEMYRLLGKNEPAFIWVDGPASGCLLLSLADQNLDQNLWQNLGQNLGQNLWQNLGQNLWQNLDQNLGQKLWQNLDQNLGQNLWQNLWRNLRQNLWQNLDQNLWQNLWQNLRQFFAGQHDYAYAAHYSFMPQIGVKYSEKDAHVLRLWREVGQSTGWWSPRENVVVACERHHILRLNEDGRLHCENGPAMGFRDSWNLWAIHGVLVDDQIVMSPQTQTVKQIEAEANQEVKRVRIERFGWERYLLESGAAIAHENFNERDMQQEKLYRLNDGSKRIVVSDPSTGRKYVLGVPREVETCSQAQSFVSHGLDALAIHRS